VHPVYQGKRRHIYDGRFNESAFWIYLSYVVVGVVPETPVSSRPARFASDPDSDLILGEIPAEATEWGTRPLFSPDPGEAALAATGRLDQWIGDVRRSADRSAPAN